MMDVRPIRSGADHAWALAQVEPYFAAPPPIGSMKGDRFQMLLDLIEAYEAKVVEIVPADPIEVLDYAISDFGRSQADLAALLGSRSRASEVLSRRRPLTLEMIRKISAAWKIPEAALMPAYRLESSKSAVSKRKQTAA